MIHQGIPKIADFGAGKEINKTTSHKNGTMGAICYLEPLRYKFGNYELKKSSDIYSLGVILWQISSGKRPFDDVYRDLDLYKKIAEGQREVPIENTPKWYIQLYKTCWDGDPERRYTIDKVVKSFENDNSTSDISSIHDVNEN